VSGLTEVSAHNDDHVALAGGARDFLDALEYRCEQLTDKLDKALGRALRVEVQLTANAAAMREKDERIAQLEGERDEAFARAVSAEKQLDEGMQVMQRAVDTLDEAEHRIAALEATIAQGAGTVSR
jgi:chromosome segregation ATPase